MRLVIKGGKIFDPTSGWDGVEQDLFIDNGRVVAQLTDVDQVINAQGLAVTPAAIDLRSAVAGYGQNVLRLWGALPSPRELGESYALLGYTHIHEPFLTFQTANYVHRELAAIPIVDTSASLTVNLRDFDIWLKDPDQLPEVSAAWSYLLEQSRALNLRLAEPFVKYRQDFYAHRSLPLEAVVPLLVRLIELSGSRITIETTPELLQADLPARPEFHLGGLGCALLSPELFEKARQHLANGVYGDMALLPPIPRSGLPSLPVKIDLDWFQPFDLNIPPSPETARRALRLALQGRSQNLAFSVATVAQTPVHTYPLLFSWLGKDTHRQREWGRDLPLASYSISDWVKCTRSLPAQILGLNDRGHLHPGARADVALYEFTGTFPSWQESFHRCRLLLKAGEVVVDNFQVVNPRVAKKTYYRRTQALSNHMVTEICRYRSFRLENLGVRPRPDVQWQQVT